MQPKKPDLKVIEDKESKILRLEKSILRIEKDILEIQEMLKKEFELQQERNVITKYGLEGLKNFLRNQLPNHRIDIRHKLFELYRNDSRLGYPHEKILKVLVNKYDGHVFGFLNVNKIVKEARIGKNKTADYLTLLEELGYILSRRVGAKHLYKVNVRVLEDKLPKPLPLKEEDLESSIMVENESREA
ncbi:hypothetical protein HYW20_08050 [Candidatus Woesearchaeota archaeon]|nr:hypothetical protein [Candidatus Woesearchaeota archaeon]